MEKRKKLEAIKRLIERQIQLFARSGVKRNGRSIKVLKSFAKKFLKNKDNFVHRSENKQ